ncbi:MAG: hypothetical protein IT431_14615 [Phycisphaerales bacterium]|nr:hypothetical protein [Phycisphaerales bacterium]
MPREDPGPSIKDKKRYEALRREGHFKEMSARIANTDPHPAGGRGGKPRSRDCPGSWQGLATPAARVGGGGVDAAQWVVAAFTTLRSDGGERRVC